jgi:hypothetical protein
MGKKSAPEYAKTSYDTGGIFGSSTSSKNGTSYKSNANMTNIGNNSLTGWNNALTAIGSNDYSNDPNFQVYQDNFNRNAQKSFETNVLNPIQSQGLMRSSGLQAATNSFNNTLADNLADLHDNYYNRQVNNLSQYKDSANTLYDMIMGINQGALGNSKAVSDYNLNKWKTEQENSTFKMIADAYSNMAGQAAGAAIAASDINVKENIKPIGEKNGYQWYEFTYKEGLGLPEGVQTGVIAQEVEKINPDAVVEINGVKHVDYSKL